MDSGKAWKASYKGFGGHGVSRFAAFSKPGS